MDLISMQMNADALVSAEWLSEILKSSPANVKVLEVTWDPSSSDEFKHSRVPSARFVDFSQGMQSSQYIPLNLHFPEHVTKLMRSAGVGRDSHVVLYDRDRMRWAARIWWTLRVLGHDNVSVLDGGWRVWASGNYQLQSGEPQAIEDGNFKTVGIKNEMISSYDDVLAIQKSKSAQIIDARLLEDFAGNVEEPTLLSRMGLDMAGLPYPSSMLAGHIPGSYNLPEDTMVDQNTGCMMDNENLKQMFISLGVDPCKPIVTSCYAGIWATLTSLALYQLGNNAPVYLGSWTEYGQRASKEHVNENN